MKTMFCAASMVLGICIGSAYAATPDSGAVTRTDSVGAPQTRPLFTIGRVEVRVWAPVAPSYNAEANGDLAAREIWGAG
jgi:hypothetical protein